MRTWAHKMIEQPIFVSLPIDQPSAERNKKRFAGWGNNIAKTCINTLRTRGTLLGTVALGLEEKCSDVFAKDVIESRSSRHGMGLF
jgi:hypothetical protein